MYRCIYRIFWTFILAFCVHQCINGQQIPAISIGMAGTTVAMTDFWSAQENQAGLAETGSAGIGFMCNNQYGVSELTSKTVAAAVPLNIGVIGCNVTEFGFGSWRTLRSGFAFSRKFSDRALAGVQLDYMYLRQGEMFNSYHMVSFRTGIITRINKKLSAGVHMANPAGISKDAVHRQILPAIIRFGFLYRFSDRFKMTIESEKQERFNPTFKGGFEAELNRHAKVRFGISNNKSDPASGSGLNTFSVAFGGCIEKGPLEFDVSASFHQILGWSPAAGIVYRKK